MQAVSTSRGSRTTYYKILQISPDATPQLTNEDVKAAYHRALLQHHPDKAKSVALRPDASREKPAGATYSIDEIITAYQTLSDPWKRRAYDEDLKARDDGAASGWLTPERSAHLGVEVFDLDDLEVDEHAGLWHRDCRCGNLPGYVVTEQELEREAQHGEIYVGCTGCSLFIKILFGVVGTEEADGEGDSWRAPNETVWRSAADEEH